METRPVTPDILVLRDQDARAVLVRGQQGSTAIGAAPHEDLLARVAAISREMSNGDLRLAVLARAAEDPGRTGSAGRSAEPWPWDDVAPKMKGARINVQQVRGTQTVYDDTGRAFHCEPCQGKTLALAVRIQPENVLVVEDDLRPDLPPEVIPGCVGHVLDRLEAWRAAAPQVIVPASGIPIAGDEVVKSLDRGIHYLRSLQESVKTQMLRNRFPWERLIYTLNWSDHWSGSGTSKTLVQRHRHNVREMAADVMLSLQADAGIAYIAA